MANYTDINTETIHSVIFTNPVLYRSIQECILSRQVQVLERYDDNPNHNHNYIEKVHSLNKHSCSVWTT